MLIDTHCHLDYFKNPGQVITKAQKAGVKFIINPGVNAQSSEKVVSLAKKYPGVLAAVGIHPTDVASENKPINKQLKTIEGLIKKERKQIVAIGEAGLDFAPVSKGETSRPKNIQIDLFKKLISLGLEYDLPLIIHNRKAHQEILACLFSFKKRVKGVFHCFYGSKKFVEKISKLGFYVGLTGLITYDYGLQQVFKLIPQDKLLIETDAPWLMPEPLRKRKKWPNEPKNVKIVAEKIADLKGDSFFKVAQQTTKNAIKLFKLY